LFYATIRANPKILVGLSDITSLLLGIHAHWHKGSGGERSRHDRNAGTRCHLKNMALRAEPQYHPMLALLLKPLILRRRSARKIRGLRRRAKLFLPG